MFEKRRLGGWLKGYGLRREKGLKDGEKVGCKLVEVVIFMFILSVGSDYNRRKESEGKW